MTRRTVVTTTTLLSLVLCLLGLASGTATAAPTLTVKGMLLGTQLEDWTYQVEFRAFDNDFNTDSGTVAVAAGGSYEFSVTGVGTTPTVNVQYIATKGDTTAYGFGYQAPNPDFTNQVAFEAGQPKGLPVDVLTGFLSPDGKAYGRPVGVAMDTRGALLVADDVGNAIWRVSAAKR